MRDPLGPQIGFYQQMDIVSPQVFMAQRMAELEQIAKYRRQKLQKFQDWSDPVKREEIKRQYNEDLKKCWALLKEIPAEKIAVRTQVPTFNLSLLMKPAPVKPAEPLTKWQKFLNLIRGR